LAKLTEKQWKEIETRLSRGEKAIDLAKKFGVTRGAISQKFSKQIKHVKTLANQIVETEIAIQTAPITIQIGAFSLANELLAISKHMATGATLSAMNYSRLSSIANKKISTLNDDALDEEELAIARTLTVMSNEAAKTPMDLIKANASLNKDQNTDQEENSFAAWIKGGEGKIIGVAQH